MISITASDVIEMGGGLDVKIGVSPDVREILEREAGETDGAGPVGHWRQILRGMRLPYRNHRHRCFKDNAEEERKLFSAD